MPSILLGDVDYKARIDTSGLARDAQEFLAKWNAEVGKQGTPVKLPVSAPTKELDQATIKLRELRTAIKNLDADARANRITTQQAEKQFKQLSDQAFRLRDAFKDDVVAMGAFSAQASRASSSADRLAGRINALSFANQINLGLQRELLGTLYAFGPAGGVAASALGSIPALINPATLSILALTGAVAGLDRIGASSFRSIQDSTLELEQAGTQNVDALRESLRGLQDESKLYAALTEAELLSASRDIVKANRDASESVDILGASIVLTKGRTEGLEDASLSVSRTLRQFNLDTSASAEVAAKFAKAGDLAETGALDMAAGLARVANQGSNAGFSITELLGALIQLDNNGYSPAEEGSRSLNTILSRLNDLTAEGKTELVSLGVAYKNLDGSSRPVRDIFFDIIKALEGSTTAGESANKIFDTFGARTIVALTSEMVKLADEVDVSSGYLDTLREKLEDNNREITERGLKTAVTDLGTAFSEMINPVLIPFLDGVTTRITTMTDAINGLQEGKLLSYVNFLKVFNPFAVPEVTTDLQGNPLTTGASSSGFGGGTVTGGGFTLNTPVTSSSSDGGINGVFASISSLQDELDDLYKQFNAAPVNSALQRELGFQIQGIEKQIAKYKELTKEQKESAKVTRSTIETASDAYKLYKDDLAQVNEQIALFGRSEDLVKQTLRITERFINDLTDPNIKGNTEQFKALAVGQVNALEAELESSKLSEKIEAIFSKLGTAGAKAMSEAAKIGTDSAFLKAANTRLELLQTARLDLLAVGATEAQLSNIEQRINTAIQDVELLNLSIVQEGRGVARASARNGAAADLLASRFASDAQQNSFTRQADLRTGNLRSLGLPALQAQIQAGTNEAFNTSEFNRGLALYDSILTRSGNRLTQAAQTYAESFDKALTRDGANPNFAQSRVLGSAALAAQNDSILLRNQGANSPLNAQQIADNIRVLAEAAAASKALLERGARIGTNINQGFSSNVPVAAQIGAGNARAIAFGTDVQSVDQANLIYLNRLTRATEDADRILLNASSNYADSFKSGAELAATRLQAEAEIVAADFDRTLTRFGNRITQRAQTVAESFDKVLTRDGASPDFQASALAASVRLTEQSDSILLRNQGGNSPLNASQLAENARVAALQAEAGLEFYGYVLSAGQEFSGVLGDITSGIRSGRNPSESAARGISAGISGVGGIVGGAVGLANPAVGAIITGASGLFAGVIDILADGVLGKASEIQESITASVGSGFDSAIEQYLNGDIDTAGLYDAINTATGAALADALIDSFVTEEILRTLEPSLRRASFEIAKNGSISQETRDDINAGISAGSELAKEFADTLKDLGLGGSSDLNTEEAGSSLVATLDTVGGGGAFAIVAALDDNTIALYDNTENMRQLTNEVRNLSTKTTNGELWANA